MPQGALAVNTGSNATATALNITAATVVKSKRGVVVGFSVLVAGAAGAIYDSISTTGNTAANQIGVIPATVGYYSVEFPALNGIVIAPGAAQVVSVAYS